MRRPHTAAARAACVLALAAGTPLALSALARGAGSGAAAVATKAAFSDPARIDNRWFPLTPGTQFTMVGRANRGHGQRRHEVVLTITDLTKVIDGVRTLVLWDRDFNAGRLQENELTFHAQDDDGTVWNYGEYPEEYKGGKVSGAPDTWIAGLQRARPGVVMLAAPRPGMPSYLQGFAPAIEFADRARVLRMGLRVCIPRTCYRNALEVDEWNPAEPGAHQSKYYASGVGNVRVGANSEDKEGEVLVLERVRHLSPGAMAWVRQQVLKVDKRADRIRADVYGRTPPLEPMKPAA
jgi:hypothetical protein